MSESAPHFVLFSESRSAGTGNGRGRARRVGQWRFVLQDAQGSTRLEARDEEEGVETERLELLAVVRGLEALDQPSRVTLVTASRYVSRGFRFGLEPWRENDWRWECYGEMIPIKNADLWRRVDRALMFHQVECRTWRFDAAETPRPAAAAAFDRRSSRRRRATAAASRLGSAASEETVATPEASAGERRRLRKSRRWLRRATRSTGTHG